jgi:Cu+-exporting ATPase
VLGKADTLVVDKTGTLTEGKPRVVSVAAYREAGLSEEELLRLAGSVERSSEHPLAAAIVKAAKEQGLTLAEATAFESVAGQGVRGRVDGRDVAVGTEGFLAGLGISARAKSGTTWEGGTVVFVAVEGRAAGAITIADAVKETTPEAIQALHKEGMRIVMLTGDRRGAAEKVARELGIDEFEAEVLPEQKTEAVQRLKKQGHVVAMAGDGVNDAPALAAADVGIAMGTGTDVAMESAGITLVKGDLRGIVRARRLSRATLRNIRQNLFFAFIYNSIGVPIAAGVLYPFFGILLSPILASAAMSFSSVSVICNALRLRRAAL